MENSIDKNLYRVGIYLRLSEEDKNKSNVFNESESIKNQRYLLLEEIKRRQNFLLVDEYVDENLSGAGTYRPEFERLIKDCETRKLDIVLCKSQSRFSRDMEIIEKYLHNKFIEWNIRFISLSDCADTSILGNKKARQINGLVNEWYLEDVSNNIRSAFRAKMLNGEFISPFTVFGYLIDSKNKNKLVIDEEASLIVKKIYSLYLQGMGLLQIAKYLNFKNIPSPSYYKYLKGIKLNIVSNKPRDKIKWSSSAVKSILTNEIYLGHLVQGKRTTISYKNHKIKKKDKRDWIKVLNTHSAIIDEDIFKKVQNSIKEKNRSSKKNNMIHIFSGKVFCSSCNGIMKKKNSTKYKYLVCSKSQDGYCDNKKSIRYDKLEKMVLKEINGILKCFYDIEILKKEFINNNYVSDKLKLLEKKKLDIEDKINNIDFYFKNIYEDKVCGIITHDRFKNIINLYEKDEIMYKNQLTYIKEELKKLEQTKDMNAIFNKYKSFDKLNRILVDEFISYIYITRITNETREIKIKWNF